MSLRSKIVILLALVVAVSLALVYVGNAKYQALLEATTQGLALGKAHGEGIGQSACLRGLRSRYASCDTTECELSANGYIAGCMEKAEPDEFCDAVPNVHDTRQSLSWVGVTCVRAELSLGRCSRYLHKFVAVCTEQVERRKISLSETAEIGFKKGANR